MDKDFFSREAEKNPFSSYLSKADLNKPDLNKAEAKNPVPREIAFPEEPNGFLPFFFVELLDRFKHTLSSVKTFTHLSREKLNDAEFREYFYRVMNEDIEEIDSVINSLLSYIKINTPIIKTNTVHIVIDEILKKNESQLNSRKIKIIKKFEKELPETIVHETQLRYIFSCILEFAMPFTLPNGSVGFLTKIIDIPKEAEENKSLPQRDGRYVEVVVVFTGYKKQGEQVDATFGAQAAQKEEKMDLKLLLVKEIVRKNHGIMKFEVDEKKPRTQISLIFPIERRRVVYYQTSGS
jgi:nitrogen-specific signal transduction histidine kinase